MNIIRLCALFYAGLIRLYPPGFRNEFGNEMHAVFVEALRDRTKNQFVSLSSIWFRELRDLPVNLLCAHLSELNRKKLVPGSPRTPEKTAGLGSIFGFGASFAFVALLQIVKTGSLLRVVQTSGSLHYDSLVIVAVRVLAYPLAGALFGAVFGLATGCKKKIALLALGGALAFYLGSRAASYIAMHVLSPSMPFSVILMSMIQLGMIGTFVGALVGLIQRDWLRVAYLAFTGAFAFALGRAAGFLIAVVFWGIAQAIASYQAPPANSWVISAAEFLSVSLTSVVGGIIGGAVLARAARQAKSNGFS